MWRAEHKTDGYSYKQMSDAGSQTDILSDSEGCLSRSKQEHTQLVASDLFNNPGLQNDGGIDLTNTVVSCSCSSSVRTRYPPAQGAVRVSRNVVAMCIGGPRLWYQHLQEVTSGDTTYYNLEP